MPAIPKPRIAIINLTIAANTTRYDVFVAAGSPTTAVQVVLVINSGVVVQSDNTTPAIVTAGFVDGCVLTIVNHGIVAGMRGAAGAGGSATAAGSSGGSGGNAIKASLPVIIDNTNGYVYGGGGGGGGGSGGAASAGGAGGAGAGNGTTAAASGSASSGDGATGGAGGDFGMPGVDGGRTTYADGASGGSAGLAVSLDGSAGGATRYTEDAAGNPVAIRYLEDGVTPRITDASPYAVASSVTWTGGYNYAQVRGSVA